jgi:hypothetical protein
MSDPQDAPNMPPPSEKIVPEWPHPSLPTVYADGALNLAKTNEIVKFYLGRADPAINTPSDNKIQVLAQVIMSMNGFIETATFFEKALDGYVQEGIVSRERRNVARIHAGLPEK